MFRSPHSLHESSQFCITSSKSYSYP